MFSERSNVLFKIMLLDTALKISCMMEFIISSYSSKINGMILVNTALLEKNCIGSKYKSY